MKESTIVIMGDDVIDYSVNHFFNKERIINKYKELDEEELPWFICVHSKDDNSYIDNDLNYMKTFYYLLKSQIYYSIVIFVNDDRDNTEHIQLDYTYGKDNDTGEEKLEEVQNLLGKLTLGQAALLKVLSRS